LLELVDTLREVMSEMRGCRGFRVDPFEGDEINDIADEVFHQVRERWPDRDATALKELATLDFETEQSADMFLPRAKRLNGLLDPIADELREALDRDKSGKVRKQGGARNPKRASGRKPVVDIRSRMLALADRIERESWKRAQARGPRKLIAILRVMAGRRRVPLVKFREMIRTVAEDWSIERRLREVSKLLRENRIGVKLELDEKKEFVCRVERSKHSQ
jgi:hypothetical protein